MHGLIRRSGVMGDGAQHPGLSRAIAAAAAQPLLTFSLAFENATVGLALFSPCGGACLRANPRFCAALELTPEALSASSLPQILQQLERGNTAASPAANGFNLNAATAVLSGERDHAIARLSLNRNGQPAGWFDLRLKAIRDSGGTLIHVLAELNDVSEAVAQTEYLQAAASAGVVGIWDWDTVHDVLTWDPVMYHLYGCRPEHFSGAYEAWSQAVHPDDRGFAEAELQAALRGKRPYAARFRVIWPDGSIHHLQAASRTFFNPQGQAIRVLGVNYDVTALVQTQADLEIERQRLNTTLDSLPDPHLILSPIRNSAGLAVDFAIRRANPIAAIYNGMTMDQIVGCRIREEWPEAVRNGLVDQYLRVFNSGKPLALDGFPFDYRDRRGTLRRLDIRAPKAGDELILTWRDDTERVQEHLRLTTTLDSLLDPHLMLAAVHDNDGQIHDLVVLRANPVAAHYNGMTTGEMKGKRLRDAWPEHVTNGLYARYLEVLDGGTPLILDRFPYEHPQQGSLRRLDIRAVKVGDDLSVTWRDVTEQAVNEEELKRRATTDSLTNLLNRAEIFRVAQQFLTGDQRQGKNMAVLFCDLDRFKQVNDRYGHRSGDLVLQAMAQRIRSCLRSSDLAARVGGDELMVILPGMHSLEDAVAIAEKVRSLARQPVPIPQGEVRISVSVGAALACPGDSLDELISRADSLMYQAKQQGRDQVVSIGCDCANSPSG
ncbi:MAG: diguanylate cyclase [Cyanobacteriota bacterium]